MWSWRGAALVAEREDAAACAALPLAAAERPRLDLGQEAGEDALGQRRPAQTAQ